MHSFPAFHSQGAQLAKLGLVTLTLIAAIGCEHRPRSGFSRGDVSIQITSGNSPLEDAFIDLTNPENGEAYGGKLDANGALTLHDVVIGEYVVTVLPPEGAPPLPGVPPTPRQQLRWKIPRVYQRPESTPFRAIVAEGTNEFGFEVTLDAAQR
ncbi:MAG: hypothetical protein ACIALR_00870 [Blastopirellula sp. JB062]